MPDICFPLDRCFNPISVPGPNGVRYFSCGHCLACHRSKHSHWRQRLVHHMLQPNTYSLFITLTYDNQHLPLVSFDKYGHIESITHTVFNRGKLSSRPYERVDILSDFEDKYYNIRNIVFPNEFFSDMSDSEVESYVSKSFPHFVSSSNCFTSTYDTQNRFAICLKKDVQDFIKRLRSILSRNSDLAGEDLSITYFICSEYGPQTFRPHYHGLLSFRSEKVSKYVHLYGCYKAWRKCSFKSYKSSKSLSKIVTNPQGAASYISKYVTCDDVLPRVLRLRPFNVFHIQSKKIPIGSEAFDLSSVPRMLEQGNILSVQQYYDKDSNEFVTVNLPFPKASWNRIFPKFAFDSLLSNDLFNSCIRRLFECAKTGEFPDTRKSFEFKYRIGELLNPTYTFKYIYQPFCINSFLTPDILLPLISPRPWDYHLLSHATNDQRYICYSDIIHRLVDDPHFVDYYLFGIPVNRAASRKVIDAFCNVDWCDSVDSYLSAYYRYKYLCDLNSLKQFSEYVNNARITFDPAGVLDCYPYLSFYLKDDIDSIDDPVYESLDNILYNNFGFGVDAFYDDDGKLIPFTLFNSSLRSEYKRFVYNDSQSFLTKRKYKHFKYQNL